MNKEDYKYYVEKKKGYGYCISNDINYIIENVERYCGNDFDLYVCGTKVDKPQEYLQQYKPKNLENKVVELLYKKDKLEDENKQLKDTIDKTREKCNYLLSNDIVEIDGKRYVKQESDDVITRYILDSLGDKESE